MPSVIPPAFEADPAARADAAVPPPPACAPETALAGSYGDAALAASVAGDASSAGAAAGGTEVAAPPAPPLLSPAMQQKVLIGLYGTSTATFALAQLDALARLPLQPFAGLLLGYALVVTLDRLPDSALKNRVARAFENQVFDHAGVGLYGFVAFGFFLSLQLDAIVEAITSFELDVPAMIVQHAIGFSVDSVMSFVKAISWPWPLMEHASRPAAAAFVGACWVTFQVLGRALPHRLVASERARLKAEAKAAKQAAKRARRARRHRALGESD